MTLTQLRHTLDVTAEANGWRVVSLPHAPKWQAKRADYTLTAGIACTGRVDMVCLHHAGVLEHFSAWHDDEEPATERFLREYGATCPSERGTGEVATTIATYSI